MDRTVTPYFAISSAVSTPNPAMNSSVTMRTGTRTGSSNQYTGTRGGTCLRRVANNLIAASPKPKPPI